MYGLLQRGKSEDQPQRVEAGSRYAGVYLLSTFVDFTSLYLTYLMENAERATENRCHLRPE